MGVLRDRLAARFEVRPSTRVLLLAISTAPTPIIAQDVPHARAALSMGDTAFAIQLLREGITDKSTPADQCLFATVLSRSATSRGEHRRLREEAKRWFDRSLKTHQDAVCLLELASLLEKQGIRVDAGRVAKRAFHLLSHDSAARTPAALAEAYYRRSIPLAEWIRNFEDLVLVRDLPVAAGTCDEQALFCEAVLHPLDFRERLDRAPPAENLVERERHVVRGLLDSTLALVPGHPDALRSALRGAGTQGDWASWLALATRAHNADPASVGNLLAVLAGLVMVNQYDSAQVVFDTLMATLGPDAMARYEGLALVADPSLRARLVGTEQVVYGEAIWGLSDPLYLTPRNERRLAHYARIVLADVFFSDPAAGVAGRDTPQGRLVIRYGLPRQRFVVRADERLRITDHQRAMMDQILACGTKPTYYLGPRQTEGEVYCVPPPSGGEAFDAGGRWEFWYYDQDGPPFMFERSLGYRVARHIFETRSRELDSLLHRTTPSAYAPPYRPGSASLVVTGFPRPDDPVVEAWSRFAPPDTSLRAGGVELGLFVHDATTGREAGRFLTTQARGGVAVLGKALRVPGGTFRVTAEALWPGGTAAQTSGFLNLVRPDSTPLWLSDLLLGDSATAPPNFAGRNDVTFSALTDTLVPARSSLAAYWENYGLAAPPGGAHYRVRLSLEDAEKRPVAARILRSVGRALGVARHLEYTVEWEVRREAGEVLPYLVDLALPDHRGDLRIAVRVEDLATGSVAVTSRVITLHDPEN